MTTKKSNMVEDTSYNHIRSMVDSQCSKIIRPLVVDSALSLVIRQYDIDPQVVNKLLVKLNQVRVNKLKRVYNKQAIHLISLQALNAMKQRTIKKFKNLLNLNLLLIPFKMSDLSNKGQNKHEFQLLERQSQLLELIEELPGSKDLVIEANDDEETQDLDEILQKYDHLIQELLKNIRYYKLLVSRLEKYESFQRLLISRLNPSLIQKNLVISSNTKIIDQMNKSRILIEKVNQKLS